MIHKGILIKLNSPECEKGKGMSINKLIKSALLSYCTLCCTHLPCVENTSTEQTSIHYNTVLRVPTTAYRGKIRENGTFCGEKIPTGTNQENGQIRKFFKKMSGKCQGIFNLFHDITAHRNDAIPVYIIN